MLAAVVRTRFTLLARLAAELVPVFISTRPPVDPCESEALKLIDPPALSKLFPALKLIEPASPTVVLPVSKSITPDEISAAPVLSKILPEDVLDP